MKIVAPSPVQHAKIDAPSPDQHERITELVRAIAAEWCQSADGWQAAGLPWGPEADEAERHTALSDYLQGTYGQAMFFDGVVAARAIEWLEHIRRQPVSSMSPPCAII